jgi:hypothetical protein
LRRRGGGGGGGGGRGGGDAEGKDEVLCGWLNEGWRARSVKKEERRGRKGEEGKRFDGRF